MTDSADPWAGIPVELREKWEAHVHALRWSHDMSPAIDYAAVHRDLERTGNEFRDALRSLLSRLQEAENEMAEARRVADELCSPCEMGHRHHLADVMEKHVFRAGINEGRSRA